MRRTTAMKKKNSYQVFMEEAPEKLRTVIICLIVGGGISPMPRCLYAAPPAMR
jgi:hypothetical protein